MLDLVFPKQQVLECCILFVLVYLKVGQKNRFPKLGKFDGLPCISIKKNIKPCILYQSI